MKFIIKESEKNEIKQMYGLINETVFPGTNRFGGANGVDETLFKQILTLMKTTYSGNTEFQRAASEVESKHKVDNKNIKTIKSAIKIINDKCDRNQNEIFCRDVNDILYSDSDNVFSDSYRLGT